jgi:hypothetical protein
MPRSFCDQARNDLIVRDLLQTFSAGCSPLVLTGRTDFSITYILGDYFVLNDSTN